MRNCTPSTHILLGLINESLNIQKEPLARIPGLKKRGGGEGGETVGNFATTLANGVHVCLVVCMCGFVQVNMNAITSISSVGHFPAATRDASTTNMNFSGGSHEGFSEYLRKDDRCGWGPNAPLAPWQPTTITKAGV